MGLITRILVLACFPFSLVAQTGTEKKILAILDNQTRAWNEGNLDQFMVGYLNSDSLMYIGKSGVTYGYQSTLNAYKKNYDGPEKMGKLSFQVLHIKKLGRRYCLVVGRWSLKRTVGDVGGHYTLTFERRKGNWLIVADHSS